VERGDHLENVVPQPGMLASIAAGVAIRSVQRFQDSVQRFQELLI
jgi:hypothetical protein